jgi:nicotinamide riboside transporter PnuC
MALRAWMKREQWLIWIAATIILTLVLAAIGYLAVEQAASVSGPVAMAAHDGVAPVLR